MIPEVPFDVIVCHLIPTERTTAIANDEPRILVIGYMAGLSSGFTTSQGLVVARLLAESGWLPRIVSGFHNRWLRLLDTFFTLILFSQSVSIGILEVYGGNAFLLADATSRLAVWLRLPLVMVLHGGSIPDLIRRKPRWAYRVFCRAEAIVVPSKYQARALDRFPDLPVRTISNVLSIERYPFRLRDNVGPRLFWMRGFHDNYNPQMALRVIKRLQKDYPQAVLCMAGRKDGDFRPVRLAAEEGGLNGAISFPGFLDMEGKLEAASKYDIFINTNRIDNMPVAVVEACAFGMPVVATRVGGIPDLLTDGETGLLVPHNDDVAMARAIDRLIADPDLAARLSFNGRQLAEACDASRIVPLWRELLGEIAGLNRS